MNDDAIALESSARYVGSHKQETGPSDPSLKNLEAASPSVELSYISGLQHHFTFFGLCLILFIAQLETSIVSTAILAITDDLKGFDESSWIFTAYMLTYGCLLIIWAKFSDILGRKPLLLAAIFIFVLFSGACGASQTLTQLIAFRCIQGAGASGIYSLAVTLIFEMVPQKRYPDYTAMVTMVLTLSVTFGPLIGGAISWNSTWRWVFLLNVPSGILAFGLLVVFLPSRLPNQASSAGFRGALSINSLRRIDVFGALLLLGGGAMIVTALQQAALGKPYNSPVVLALLIVAGLLWAIFFIWEWFVSTRRSFPEPVFPWRFVTNRVCVGMLLNTYFSGTIFLVCVAQIPQRFQTVNGNSAFVAGTRLIPFSLFVPFAATLAATFIGKTKVPPVIILIIGGVLEIIGTVGISKTSTSFNVASTQYGFQIVTGLGVGVFSGGLVLIAPFIVEKRDLAVATAAVTQFRTLGGLLGIAIVTGTLNRSIRASLLKIIPSAKVDELLSTTGILYSFPEPMQTSIRTIFGQGYNVQMVIMIGFAAAQIPASLLMWTKKPLMQ